MKYVQLGNSDLQVSEISVGGMSLAEGKDAHNIRLLHKALDLGVNLFDTADLYQHGRNEETFGKAFQGMRQQVILATKVGNQWRSDGSGWDWNPRKDYILESIEGSLRRLKTDYIDLYQLHGGAIDDPVDETIEAFEILKQQGKIRFYGISSIRPNVIREYSVRSKIISVMTQYSLLDRRPEEETLELLRQNKIGVLVRGAVAKGLLIDKVAKDYLNRSAEEVARAAEAVAKISSEARSKAQTAIKYVLQHPAISTTVVGIRTEQQLLDAFGASGAEALTPKELKTLQDVLPPNLYEKHR